MFFLQQAAAEIVRNFEDFFDNVLWRTVVNPQSGEFENFFTANPLWRQVAYFLSHTI